MEEKENVEEVYSENSDIELHPETVKQRQDTYSSLTDLEGINIFYDSFQEIVLSHQNAEDNKFKSIAQKVFIDEIVGENSEDMQITSKLFQKQDEIVLKHDYQKENEKTLIIDISLILIAVLAVAALYIFFFNNKKIRRR